MEELLQKKSNKKIVLLGNEGVIRGALEAGVQFVSTYPGTPASEIGNIFYKIAKKAGVYFEFSTNEKVAMEAAAGASFCGLRSLVAMKHFGLNVASDFFLTLMYGGVKGGMVIFNADDPSCWSSAQSEQNARYYSLMAHIPTLEPSTPQECKDFTKLAFELSEKFKIPIIIRTTTRVSHQSAPVSLEKIKKLNRKPVFVKDLDKFSTMPPRVLEMKRELLEKIKAVKELSEKSKINIIKNQQPTSEKRVGIITSGVSYLYVMEALKELNLKLPVLKLGFIYPLPEEKIKKFISRAHTGEGKDESKALSNRKMKKVLIVEELEPYLEREIKILAKDINPKLEILGKEKGPIEGGRIWKDRKNILPEIGELKPEYVISAVAKITGKKTKTDFNRHLKEFEKVKALGRPPILCPGCPYWFIVSAIKKAVDLKKVVFGGEIGCYMLFRHPTINIQDYLYCMGSTNGLAHGISKSSKQKVITFIGDSSFFHSGIPPLINTVFNKSNPLIFILNNKATAMTGHQPHPGIGKKEEENGTEAVEIEKIVKACGVKNLKVIDQKSNQKELEKTIKNFLKKDEVSVIIARSPCLFVKK